MYQTSKNEILSENSYLVVYIPATNKAFVWRVISVENEGYYDINYGPLPIPQGYPFASYVAGSVPAPAAGVIPAACYTPLTATITFPLPNAYDPTDMWYIPKDYRERVFDVIEEVTPGWLRLDVTIPQGVSQGKFQRTNVSTGIDKLFGYVRGSLDVIHVPELRYGYRYGNDSSLNVYTGIRFRYGEYIIETPKNPELIFSILTKQMKVDKWVNLPIEVYDSSIQRALIDDYGFDGFPIYSIADRAKAIPVYTQLLKEALV